jgi:hypothetical protein
MKIDLETAQAEIDEYVILLDLKTEECAEWKARAKVLEGQLALVLSDYKVADVL